MQEWTNHMNLTSEQSAIVDLADGRHLVLAPPGSGKTEMLSLRIIRALSLMVPPDKMLCATFTNRTAFEMRVSSRANLSPSSLLRIVSVDYQAT